MIDWNGGCLIEVSYTMAGILGASALSFDEDDSLYDDLKEQASCPVCYDLYGEKSREA